MIRQNRSLKLFLTLFSARCSDQVFCQKVSSTALFRIYFVPSSRIQHIFIRELNSLEYHGDISSFFRSRGCQSVVRNTYSLLCIQSRWNEIPGAGFLNELQDAEVLPVFVRERGMAELSKERVFTLNTGED